MGHGTVEVLSAFQTVSIVNRFIMFCRQHRSEYGERHA